MLVGAGALEATDEVIAVAERLQAGVAKALLGKAALPDDLPFVTGSIGLARHQAELGPDERLRHVLDGGLRLSLQRISSEAGRRARRADRYRRQQAQPALSRWKSTWSATARRRCVRCCRCCNRRQIPPGAREIEKGSNPGGRRCEERAMDSADPLNPQRVFWELSPRLPDNAIITADSGSVANWYARDLKMRRGMKASLSGGLASLGAGTPYAVAGKMAFPDRTVIACMGDGAMQMNGLNVMITISKYWKQWSNPRLIVLVLNNRDLNQVTWEERVQLGAGKTELTQSIPDFPYHKYAELIGLKGIFVDRPGRGRRRLGRGACLPIGR